mgnify:CR=1 FL=1
MGLRAFVPALGADAVFVQGDSAEGAALYGAFDREFLGGGINSAGEGDFRDVQLLFQEVIDNLDHALHRHGFLRHHKAAFRVGGGERGLERRPFHRVLRVAVLDALLFVDAQNRGEQRVVFAQNEGVVEIPQNVPGRLLDFIAGEHHVHPIVDGILHLDGKDARVTVKVLGLALETVETVGVLQAESGKASHIFSFVRFADLIVPVVYQKENWREKGDILFLWELVGN